MSATPPADGQAAELRRAFDQSFAAPPQQDSQETEDLLTIRVDGHPYAIRLREFDGVVAGRKVVPVPSVTHDLLGLAGVRGGIVPVFCLSSVLGYRSAPGSPRWLILCGGDDPLALALSSLEGYVRLPRSSLHSDQGLRSARAFADQVASMDGGFRPVLSIPLIVAAIRNRPGPHRLAREQ
jgi:purine-binding chemotaxis protein CheW